MLSPKQVWMIIASALAVIFALLSPKMAETVDAGEVVVIQSAVTGKLEAYTSPGLVWQWFGTVTSYPKSNTFYFNKEKDSDGKIIDKSIPIKWNDGAHASISGSIRYDLPTDPKQIVDLHSIFRSPEGIESSLIRTNVVKAIFMTGPLMTSKESYAERRNDIINYIEDQASRGVFKTESVSAREEDPLTGEERVVTKVRVVRDTVTKDFARQEPSPIAAKGVRIYNIAIDGIEYSAAVEKQIQVQQQATMQVQTAIANAKRAEQDAITIAKQGEADAAKAKWDQEVLKAKIVTEAEARKKVAELDVQTAQLEKQRQILEGEGIAAKKSLIMKADGALDQKLQTYKEVQKYWAEAFANYGGNVVPTFSGGGAAGNQNGALQFMDIMGAKAARDLSLDLSNKK